MIEDELLKQRINNAGQLRRWYQFVPYGNISYPTHFDDGKTNPKSYGEGRWNNYIKLAIEGIRDLDTSNSVMCEVGCSAGLFLLRAWQQFHFKRLIGIEAADGGFAQLSITKDYYDKMPLLAYKVSIGQMEKNIVHSNTHKIDMQTFPIVDVTLMSCVHYHMVSSDLLNYLITLADKSMYLILLTDEQANGVINASSEHFERMINSIGVWDKRDEIRTDKSWLKHKCKDLSVLIYKSRNLKRLNVNDCFHVQTERHKYNYNYEFYNKIFPSFVHAVLAGKINEENCTVCLVYNWQRKGFFGSTSWPANVTKERVLSYINIAKTINEHGQEQPIKIQTHLDMVDPWDGFYRIAVLKYLGWKYVYGKDVIPDVRS